MIGWYGTLLRIPADDFINVWAHPPSSVPLTSISLVLLFWTLQRVHRLLACP